MEDVAMMLVSLYFAVAMGLWAIQTWDARVRNISIPWSAVFFTLFWFISIPVALLARRYYGEGN